MTAIMAGLPNSVALHTVSLTPHGRCFGAERSWPARSYLAGAATTCPGCSDHSHSYSRPHHLCSPARTGYRARGRTWRSCAARKRGKENDRTHVEGETFGLEPRGYRFGPDAPIAVGSRRRRL